MKSEHYRSEFNFESRWVRLISKSLIIIIIPQALGQQMLRKRNGGPKWVNHPTGNTVIAITFANYILQPFFAGCAPPDVAVRLLAAVVICQYFLFVSLFYLFCLKVLETPLGLYVF